MSMTRKLSDYERGRIEGALAFWRLMAHNDNIVVPSVDSVLGLPKGTTKRYLLETEE